MSRLGWLLLRREWRRGESLILSLSLLLVVVALYVLGGFSSLLQQSLERQSAIFLGGDRMLSSTRPLPETWGQHIAQLGLSTSTQLEFKSMAFAGNGALHLVDVQAVDQQYPLQGILTVRGTSGEAEPWQGPPPRGELFVDHRLAELLGIALGDTLSLGESTFTVSSWLVQQPEVDFAIFGSSPKVLLNQQDVAATGLVQPGSRLTYRWFIAGAAATLTQLDHWLQSRLTPIQRYRGVRDEQSTTGRSLQRTEQFLNLSGVLTVLLGTAALAVAARRFCQRQWQQVTVLKTLGYTRRTLRALYVQYLGGLVLAGLLLGSVLGMLGLYLLSWRLSQAMPLTPSWWQGSALGWAILTALSSVLLFVWPALQRLFSATPMQARQGRVQTRSRARQVGYALLVSLWVMALLYGFGGSLLLALVLGIGGWLAGLLVWLTSALLLRLAESVRTRLPLFAVLALTSMRRRLAQNRILLSGFVAASLLVVVIYFARADMLQQWRQQLPDGAANQFAINIAPQQEAAFMAFLQQQNWSASRSYPVVRGRLTEVNGKSARERVEQDSRGARQSINRELSLTSSRELPPGNLIEQGQFNLGQDEVSVEAELASRLGLTLGDVLTFDVGGLRLQAKATSFRKVDWNSLRPNFFMMLSPELLQSVPNRYMVSFHVPAAQQQQLSQLIKAFPTVTLISIDEIVNRLSAIIQQASQGMTIILVLVVCAAVLLLLAQIQSTIEARQQELVVMQTLGTQRTLLLKITLAEFAALGMLAGFIACVAAEIVLAGLYDQLFDMEMMLHPMLWLVGPGSCTAVVLLAGWGQCRHLLREGALNRYTLHAGDD